MKNIFLIFGIIFLLFFIFLIAIEINEIYTMINLINSGTVILEKDFNEHFELKNINYQISGSYKNRIELFLNIKSKKYHKNNDEIVPDYFYSFIIYQEDEKKDRIKCSGIISSDSCSTINTRYNLSQSTSLNNGIFNSNLSFKVFLYDFNSIKKTNYKLNFILHPDDKYNSDLIGCKLIIKENVKDIKLFDYVIKIITLGFIIFVFFILGLLFIFLFIYKNITTSSNSRQK